MVLPANKLTTKDPEEAIAVTVDPSVLASRGRRQSPNLFRASHFLPDK